MKYASVYSRKRSPFWYISYLDAGTGKRLHTSTVHRTDDPQGRRRAYDEAMQLSKEAVAKLSRGSNEGWGQWVLDWFRINHSGRTLQSYLGSWSHVQEFLEAYRIGVPRALTYDHGVRYIGWRTDQVRPRGTKIEHNTALQELKVLKMVMHEAVRRGYADGNPLVSLRIRKRETRQRPEITASEQETIMRALESRPGWMRDCFIVAIHQGCRLTETQVPLDQVDVPNRTIKFRGKGRKEFTTQLHPAVARLAEEKRATGARRLCDLPPMAAKLWHFFFKEIGLGHLCFHSTRVTVVTRLARAGVPQGIAQSYVGHASETVHRIYQRLTVADLASAVSAIPDGSGIQDAPAPRPRTPRRSRSARRETANQAPA